MFVNFLKNDTSSLRSSTVLKKATKFIEKLEMLADDLQYDDSLISIIEQPSTSSLSPPMSPPIAAKRKTNNNNNSNNNQKQPLKASQPPPSTVVSRIEII
jgi:hypothetical protein